MKDVSKLLRALTDSILAPAVVVWPDLRVASANPGSASLAPAGGMSPEKAVGRNIEEYLPGLPIAALSQIREVLATGTGVALQHRFLQSGRWVNLEVEVAPCGIGVHQGALVVLRDVTARRDTELLTHLKEDALERSPSAVAMLDLEGYVSYANPAFLSMWRLARIETPTGLHFSSLWNGKAAYDDVVATVRTVGNWTGELVAFREDETTFPVSLQVSTLANECGDPVAMLVGATDIGETMHSEDALSECEATLRALLEAHPEATLLLDRSGVVLLANRAAGATLECPDWALVGQPLASAVGRESATLLGAHIQAVTTDRVAVSWESSSEGRAHRNTLSPIGDGMGGVKRMILTILDLTPQKSAEAALGQSQRALLAVFDSAPVGIVTFDARGVVTSWNRAAERLFGRSEGEAVGMRVAACCVSTGNGITDAVENVLAGQVTTSEATCQRADGVELDVLLSAGPILDEGSGTSGGVITAADVTAHNRLQTYLLRAHKMDAAVELAGGVSHGIANLLQALLSNIEVLKLRSMDPARVLALAESIELQVRRGMALKEKLQLFSRGVESNRKTLNLTRLLGECSTMLRTMVPDNIAISADLPEGSLMVEADAEQIRQLVAILGQNAVEAMPSGGRITLRSRRGDSGCFLEILDTGIGIPKELELRVLDPFFTTKDPFQHPGLGLAVAHSVVAEHNGAIKISSIVGQGTAVRVELPLLSNAGEEIVAAAVASPRTLSSLDQGKGERILVVEDEDGAREGLFEMLTMLGYSVVAVASGKEAEMLPPEWRFDAVLTDLVLPDVSGPDLVLMFQQRWPESGVILMSGYSEDEVLRRIGRECHVQLLRKPFDMSTLSRELRGILNPTAAPAS